MKTQAYQIDASRNWTDAQRDGVLDRSGSLAVSAAAGTGKTSVLTERCVSLVAPADGPNIDELLVVTFTEAAALEMRSRIRDRLGKLHATQPSSRLTRQLALLDAAPICTLHAFCLQIVRENFSSAGIEPDADVLGDDEAQMLGEEILAALFDDLYKGTGDRSRQFAQFVAHYGRGNDRTIREQVKHLHEYLRSLPPARRHQWKDDALAAYGLAEGTLTAKQFDRLREAIANEIDLLLEMGRVHLAAFEAQVGEHPGLEVGRAFQQYVEQLRTSLDKITTQTAMSAWLETARVTPSTRVSRWGQVDQSYRKWPKWLSDHWDKDVADRWLAKLDAWGHGLSLAAPFADLLVWLVDQFGQRYSHEKRRIGKIDYSDMEEFACGLLADETGQPTQIARACQRRYRVVLVDEFQDINPIQAEILRMVSRESADPPEPNLFTVGDVKQSIYGFRMTDPTLLLRRQQAIGEGRIAGRNIHLQENFRSRPEILAFINRLFRKLMRGDETGVDYDAQAELKPGRTDCPAAGSPAIELHLLDGSKHAGEEAAEGEAEGANEPQESLADQEKEAWLIASRIQALLGAPYRDGQTDRPLRYRDMVILLRSTRNTAEAYANVLRRCGIPVYAELRSGYFASREIQDMLSLLQVLENMQQDIPLAAVLRSPLLGEPLSDADLADIRLARGDLEFHQAVRFYAESGTDEALRCKLARQVDLLDRWRADARLMPLAEVIATIYRQTGLLEYATLLDDGPQCRANLVSLYERARQFGQFSRQGLRRFVTFVTEMIRSGREATAPTAVSEAQDVVRIMSVHACKGLEFPVVFLAGLARKFNDSDFQNAIVLDREGTLGMEACDSHRMVHGDTLVKLLAARKVRRQGRSEELRVLYVAMTRAKERLVLVGTPPKDPAASLAGNAPLWKGWTTPLPQYVIRHASTLLDWIIPALAARDAGGPADPLAWRTAEQPASPSGPDLFAITVYPREATDKWQIAEATERPTGAQILATFDNVPPHESADAQRVIARLTRAYPLEKLTHVPAITPVTELKGRLAWDAIEDDGPRHAAAAGHERAYRASLPVPRRLRPAGPGEAARQRGTATHLFLEKVDLAAPVDRRSLQQQLDSLVDERLLSRVEAEQIDLASVEWFLDETELGRILRRNCSTVRRELPFLLRLEPQLLAPGSGSDDLADAGIVRGVIDVLWTTPDGVEIADFKTDAVTGAALEDRVRLYKHQLWMYAEAIRRIWGKPPQRLWLAFLHARHIEPFTPAALRG